MRTAVFCALALGVVLAIGCTESQQTAPAGSTEPDKDESFVARSGGISNVSALQGVKPAVSQLPDQQGELQMHNGAVSFVGNGAVTPSDVMARSLEIYAGTDASLKPYVSSPEAHYFCAAKSLASLNAKLALAPDQPIPAGVTFEGGSAGDLKALLEPFKNNLAQLREMVADMVADMKTGMSGHAQTTGSGVYSKGQPLPVGVDGGSEPAPQAGDLSALGGPKAK